MDLQPYVDRVRHELDVTAAAGGAEAAELATRLSSALESAIRLALLEALSEAAELITRDVAPASVDVRLRGRDPEFVVDDGTAVRPQAAAPLDGELDGGTWRVTLRLPEHFRPHVDAAARSDGLSVNAWLTRAVASTLHNGHPAQPKPVTHFSGWVR